MSSLRSTFGSALLSTSAKDSKSLELSHLVIAVDDIRKYLTYIDEKYSTLNLKPGSLDGITKQPSSLGLAVIAHHYNKKGDQHTPIYVATRITDYQAILSEMAKAPNGTKTILVSQMTDNIEDENMCYGIHKAVFYLEKKSDCLHMVFADLVPVPSINEFYLKYASKVLEGHKCQYYFLTYLKKDDKPIFFQSDFWSCGTHSFRVARYIAKSTDFLASLELTKPEITTKNITIVNFTIYRP